MHAIRLTSMVTLLSVTDGHIRDIASLADFIWKSRETEKGSSTFYSSVLVSVACVNEDYRLCPPSTSYRLPAAPDPSLFASPPQRNPDCAAIWKVELTSERPSGSRALSVTPSAKRHDCFLVQTGYTCFKFHPKITDPPSDSSALYSSLLLSHHALRYRRSRCNRYEKLLKLQQL